ncbi:MAG TPA: DUF6268 family outer membrane beta-barrel protein [Bacteroidia bacterium]|nr:DUF6268 family outer membrane beta-barrel protein [Bacteroidia bacterium]
MSMRGALLILVFAGTLVPYDAFGRYGPGDSSAVIPAREKYRQRVVRNYIRPTLYFDNFSVGDSRLRSANPALTKRLGKYAFGQTNLGFYAPLYTSTKPGKKDSTSLNTFHLLLTLNAVNVRPRFSELQDQHSLYKAGIGLRGIWGFNSKCVLFTDLFPFVTGDRYKGQNSQQWRMGGSVIFNCMVKPTFSWRIGFTKNFLLGNRFYMPMVGFRWGALDGPVYFQLQFPRHTALVIQPSPKFSFTLYSRSYGGLYNLSNTDSIYSGQEDRAFQMGQWGLANGIRFDVRPNPNISFYFSTGFAVRTRLRFYSFYYNQQNNAQPLAPFYYAKPDPALFIHVGVSFRFGKSKKVAGNYLMYDIFDINNTMDPGDEGSGPGNSDIPRKYNQEEMQNVQYRDVVDLIDETDLY